MREREVMMLQVPGILYIGIGIWQCVHIVT